MSLARKLNHARSTHWLAVAPPCCLGIWDKTTGMLGATGRDQVTSIVVLYGPRTTALVACDDGVYEFTCGEGNKWFASRENIKIKQVLPFSPKNILCKGQAKLMVLHVFHVEDAASLATLATQPVQNPKP